MFLKLRLTRTGKKNSDGAYSYLCESLGLGMDLVLYEDSIKYDFWVKVALIFLVGKELMVNS